MFTLASMKNYRFLVLLLFPFNAFSQAGLRDSSISMTMVIPGYSFQVPFGDLSKRFGANSNLGLNVIYKNRHKWMVGVQGGFLFGNKVEQNNLFSNLVSSSGYLLGIDGRFADVRTFERGFSVTACGGKLFSKAKPNPNCGFFFLIGGGFLQHKIRIEDKNKVMPALVDDYKKGYDRLANGWCLQQSVGYIYLSNHRLINFFGALECMQGFTKSRRNYNFDDLVQVTEKRTDILLGLRIGWVLPIFKASPEKYYLY